ncbi:MAG: hypothetical protein QM656_00990 [Paracoccaceae bacterium]
MKGWQIFLHSVRQVTGNLEGALRVSALPYVIAFIVGMVLVGVNNRYGPDAANAHAGVFSLASLLSLAVSIAVSLWMAVAWHRFVLLDERPAGFVPPWKGDRMVAYFLNGLGYGLVIIIAGVIWATIVGLALRPVLAGSAVLTVIVMALLVQLPILTVALRLATALPGAAVGDARGFLAGWKATEGHTADIAVLAVIAVLANLALALLGGLLFGRFWILAAAWQFVAGWLLTMIGISILTTLYGHYVQGRRLV